MSTLSDGLAARDKATKGPWIKSRQEALIHAAEGSEVGYIAMIGDTGNDFGNSLDDIFITPEVLANIDLIVAAPDALDWIAKVLPYLKTRAEEIQYELDIQGTCIGPRLSDDCIELMKRDLGQLTALIAEAEGAEKEGENDRM